jgi:hypothetical protein
MAFQQGSVVAEEKMIRATNFDVRPSVRRQTIINRLDVGQYLTAFGVGLATMVTLQKHGA